MSGGWKTAVPCNISKLLQVCVTGAWLFVVLPQWLFAQPNVKRPRIVGISHAAIYVHDTGRARAFYEGFLGFDELRSLKREDGSDRIILIKINDAQSLELFAEDAHDDGQFSHIALTTNDAEKMRAYLLLRGVAVPDTIHKSQTGNLFFTVRDPNNHLIEIVERKGDGFTAGRQGQSLGTGRISTRLAHVGLSSPMVGPALKFYRDILGFREFWHGSSADDQLHWISIRVPDGDDFLELMTDKGTPSAQERALQNHIGLQSADLAKTMAELKSRTAKYPYAYPLEISLGKDRKGQAMLDDPDGVHIEITEEAAEAGKPAASSAPPGARN